MGSGDWDWAKPIQVILSACTMRSSISMPRPGVEGTVKWPLWVSTASPSGLCGMSQKVTMDLAKEVRVGVGLQGLKTKTGRYGRSVEEVKKRWAEWKKLEEDGMTPAQIARRWSVDRGTVEYAKLKGYCPNNPKPRNQVPTSLIGHELVSLPPTRKGHGKHRNRVQLRLAA